MKKTAFSIVAIIMVLAFTLTACQGVMVVPVGTEEPGQAETQSPDVSTDSTETTAPDADQPVATSGESGPKPDSSTGTGTGTGTGVESSPFTGVFDMGDITPGATISTTTVSAGGDMYTFSATAGQSVTITVTAVGSYDTIADLYNPSNVIITSDDDTGTGLNPLISNFVLPVTGTYTLVVRGYNGMTGQYSLTVSFGSSTANTGSTGCVSGSFNMGSISIGQTLSSFTVSAIGDVYTFSGTAGQVVNIAARGTGDEDDTYIALFGPNCAELTHDDDSGDGFSSLISAYTLPSTGTYTIQVRFYGGATDNYDLGLSTSSSSSSSSSGSSSSGSSSSALCVNGGYPMGAISFGQTRSSFTIDANGDVYTFSGTAGQVVNIAARGTGTEDDTYLALFGPNCVELTNDDDTGDGLSALISGYTLPSTGTYTIQVHFYGAATGSYDLGLTQGNSSSSSSSSSSNTSSSAPNCVSHAYPMGAITIGQTRSSFTLNNYGDVYTFSGTAGQVINIAARGTGTEDDTYIALFGPNCTELTHDDDSGDGLSSLIHGYTLPSTGTYTIQVRFFGGATGNYDIGLSLHQ